MRLQNLRAPLKNLSPDFHDVFVQVIKLHHLCVAANQAIIKLFTRRIFAASIN